MIFKTVQFVNLTICNSILRNEFKSCTKLVINRLYATQVQKKIDIIEKTKKPKKRKSHNAELNEYFETNSHLLPLKNRLPNKLLRCNLNTPDNLHLIDPDVAKTIAFQFKNLLKTKKFTVIEANPGLGLLTNELLTLDVKKCLLFETNAQFVDELKDTYKDAKVHVSNGDFFSIWKLAYQDRFDNGTRVADMLKQIKPKAWANEPSVKVFGTMTHLNFIKHLISAIVFQTSLVNYGRFEFFLTIPSSVYTHLTATPETSHLVYRSNSVLFQLFFKIKLLQKLPRRAFLPWQSVKNYKKNNIGQVYEQDFIYLVHFVPNKHMPVPTDQLQALWYFVRYHLVSRKNKVVDQLERWIPGCGSKFITASNRSQEKQHFKNIGIFTQFGDLSPEQILDIFKLFISLPEYSECPFIASMESTLVKLETTDESVIDFKIEQEHLDMETAQEDIMLDAHVANKAEKKL